jgi:hypothetical protein
MPAPDTVLAYNEGRARNRTLSTVKLSTSIVVLLHIWHVSEILGMDLEALRKAVKDTLYLRNTFESRG